jgi:beta-N-acetylhexosaminidase
MKQRPIHSGFTGLRVRLFVFFLAAALPLVPLSGCGRMPAETPGGASSSIPAEGASSAPAENVPSQSSAASSEDGSAQSAALPPEDSETEPETPASREEELLGEMTLQEKVYQLFVVLPEQLTEGSGTVTMADEATTASLARYPVGGILYKAANLQTPEQCKALLSGTQSASRLGLFLAVDEEGGLVARVGNNAAMGTTKFPSMAEIGQTGDPEEAYNVGYTIGTQLLALGFNYDFAPVSDVVLPEGSMIGSRSFGSDPALVSDMVASCVQGFGDAGMICSLKHFPGHGDTTADSHTVQVVIDKSLSELETRDLLPFQAGIAAGADTVMVGHISNPTLIGDDRPASLSYTVVTEVLREELGFQGVVITDALDMAAITSYYTPEEAAVLALQAGVDLLLEPADLTRSAEGILDAVADGTLREERIDESVMRILRLKLARGILS